MAKISNMEVRRVGDSEIIVQENLKDEIGCYISKRSDDSIEGRYLHNLAIAVLDSQQKVDKLVKSVSEYLLALDQWSNSDKAERRVKQAERDVRQAIIDFKDF